MTVTTEHIQELYLANGVTTRFPVAFAYQSAADLEVRLYDEDSEILAVDADDNVLDPRPFFLDGGAVVLQDTAHPAAGALVPKKGQYVLVARRMALTQPYSPGASNDSIEVAFDRVVMAAQQLLRRPAAPTCPVEIVIQAPAAQGFVTFLLPITGQPFTRAGIAWFPDATGSQDAPFLEAGLGASGRTTLTFIAS